MRVLVLGGGGMLGHKVVQVLSTRFETFATVSRPTHYPLDKVITGVNVMKFNRVAYAFAQVKPNVVINCIGLVKQIESSALNSIMVNAAFPHQLDNLCEATKARMIHISTDCVFSGRKGNYTERDIPDPEDLYGQTKLLGEPDRCLTIRTSIIGRDFTKQIGLLEWFLSQKQVRGYTNAIFTGFTTQVLARIIGDIIANHTQLSGLYHIASTPISKYDLLVKIRDAMGLDIEITPYDDPLCDRSLNPARFLAATNYKIPSWDEMIAEMAADTTPYDEWRAKYYYA